MPRLRVRHEELWEPWKLGDDTPEWERDEYDIPDELVARFQIAKAQMTAVWEKFRVLMLEQDEGV